jgi:hypothetical protein
MRSVSRKQPQRITKVELRRDKLIRRRRRLAERAASQDDAEGVAEILFEVSDDLETAAEEPDEAHG